MMDADCYKHNIKWDSTENGIECPVCSMENKLATLTAERDAFLQILRDVQQGNYDNANEITYANRFIARRLAELKSPK